MYGRSTAGGIAGMVFPSLCLLQENLQLPFFLSMLAPPVGGAATAVMVYHGGVHHRVEEMGSNSWPSDLEWKADIYASLSRLKSIRHLSFPKKLRRLGSRRRWPWTTPRPWISSRSSLSTSSPPAPPLPPSIPPPPTFPSSVTMDDPKILDLIKELVVHLLSTRSPSPSIDPSVTAVADLPVAGGHGQPQDPGSCQGARCPPPLHPLPLSLRRPLSHRRCRSMPSTTPSSSLGLGHLEEGRKDRRDPGPNQVLPGFAGHGPTGQVDQFASSFKHYRVDCIPGPVS